MTPIVVYPHIAQASDDGIPKGGVIVSDDYELGQYSCAVSTQSEEAQRWFDRRLMCCYGRFWITVL